MSGRMAFSGKNRRRWQASKGRASSSSGPFIVTGEEGHGDLKAIDEMQAVGVTTVPARASAPPRKSRTLLRKRFAATAAEREASQCPSNQVAEGGGALEGVDRKTICEEVLAGGHVQAFVDFFYLTHRPGPFQDSVGPEDDTTEIDVPKVELIFLRDNLVSAESARRTSDIPAVYEAYIRLAQYYEERNDLKTSAYFHEKCLETSRMSNDRRGEMNANHRLGLTYENMGDVATATSFHERHEELAQALDISDEQKVANAALAKVYRKCAEEHEMNGSNEDSIEFWTKSLEAAKAAEEKAALGHACYRLGKAYTELGNPTRAANYLEDFQSICGELDDLEGQGRACEALAAVYQNLGDNERALSLLQQDLDIAAKTQNLEAQEVACSNLGVLQSRKGQHAKAKDMFERNFMISRKILGARKGGVTTAHVDMPRALLGIATGNDMVGEYMNAVVNDFGALLDWKINRVRPTAKRLLQAGGGRLDMATAGS